MPRHRCVVVPIPVSPIEKLAAKFREVLHLPDASPLYVLMGSVAANLIDGPPVWMMLVGPPSCGKTEILNSLLSVKNVIEAADLTGEAAFLSGTSSKEVAANASGGLLMQIGTHGGLILNDFTSVLSKPRDRVAALMAVFRECYGGRWTRHIGSDGGRKLNWVGRLALFAGVTSKIDQHHQVSAELGERWVYFRYAWRETYQEVSMALSNTRGNWREDLQAHVKSFFTDLGLEFGKSSPRREFTVPEKVRLYRMASVAAACRSGVARDPYTHEIIACKEVELAVRLSTVLGQLLLGLDLIGVPERTRWKLLTKVAMDSMPLLRRRIIDSVAGKPLTAEELLPLCEVSIGVLKRAIEDLTVHGIVTVEAGKVAFSEWMKVNYKPDTKVRS